MKFALILSMIVLIIIASAIALVMLGMTGSVAYSPEPAAPPATVSSVSSASSSAFPLNMGILPWRDLIVDPGCTMVTDPGGARYITGTVKNSGPLKYPYVQIEIDFYNDAGALIGSGQDSARDLGPSGAWQWRIPAPEKGATRAEVTGVAGYV